jgi:hypothetical protein
MFNVVVALRLLVAPVDRNHVRRAGAIDGERATAPGVYSAPRVGCPSAMGHNPQSTTSTDCPRYWGSLRLCLSMR